MHNLFPPFSLRHPHPDDDGETAAAAVTVSKCWKLGEKMTKKKKGKVGEKEIVKEEKILSCN
jgi:hypothetical protein